MGDWRAKAEVEGHRPAGLFADGFLRDLELRRGGLDHLGRTLAPSLPKPMDCGVASVVGLLVAYFSRKPSYIPQILKDATKCTCRRGSKDSGEGN
jgi:hypothetical protein